MRWSPARLPEASQAMPSVFRGGQAAASGRPGHVAYGEVKVAVGGALDGRDLRRQLRQADPQVLAGLGVAQLGLSNPHVLHRLELEVAGNPPIFGVTTPWSTSTRMARRPTVSPSCSGRCQAASPDWSAESLET